MYIDVTHHILLIILHCLLKQRFHLLGKLTRVLVAKPTNVLA